MSAAFLLLFAVAALAAGAANAQEAPYKQGLLGRIVEVGAGLSKGAYCVFSGCDNVSVLANGFDPNNNKVHTCKEVLWGGPRSVEMYVCVVDLGGVISMTGDLIVVIVNRTNKKAIVTSECWSKFVPYMEFAAKTYNGWGSMSNTLGPDKRHDFYVLEYGLKEADRTVWKFSSENKCTWAVEFPDEKKPEEKKLVEPDKPATSMSADDTKGSGASDSSRQLSPMGSNNNASSPNSREPWRKDQASNPTPVSGEGNDIDRASLEKLSPIDRFLKTSDKICSDKKPVNEKGDCCHYVEARTIENPLYACSSSGCTKGSDFKQSAYTYCEDWEKNVCSYKGKFSYKTNKCEREPSYIILQ